MSNKWWLKKKKSIEIGFSAPWYKAGSEFYVFFSPMRKYSLRGSYPALFLRDSLMVQSYRKKMVGQRTEGMDLPSNGGSICWFTRWVIPQTLTGYRYLPALGWWHGDPSSMETGATYSRPSHGLSSLNPKSLSSVIPTHSHLCEVGKRDSLPPTLAPGAFVPATRFDFISIALHLSHRWGRARDRVQAWQVAPHHSATWSPLPPCRTVIPQDARCPGSTALLAPPSHSSSCNHLFNPAFARPPPRASFTFPVLLLGAQLREQVLISG